MPSTMKTTVSAIALVALVQFCPAPFLAAIPAATAAGIGAASAAVGAASAVAGTVIAGVNTKREVVGSKKEFMSRIKRQDYGTGTAWQDCHDQLTTSSLTFSSPSDGAVLVTGMPPACMTLSTVITGQFNEGNPVPQGNDAILFSGLSAESIQEIQDALNVHA